MALIENEISKDLLESDFIGKVKCRFYYTSLEVLLYKKPFFTLKFSTGFFSRYKLKSRRDRNPKH